MLEQAVSKFTQKYPDECRPLSFILFKQHDVIAKFKAVYSDPGYHVDVMLEDGYLAVNTSRIANILPLVEVQVW